MIFEQRGVFAGDRVRRRNRSAGARMRSKISYPNNAHASPAPNFRHATARRVYSGTLSRVASPRDRVLIPNVTARRLRILTCVETQLYRALISNVTAR
jgi:hypothetical protein